MKNQRIKIAAGIILDADQKRVFIAERNVTAHTGGFWEFSGGKIEQGESPEQAVIRELEEEVGITPTQIEHFMFLEHDYADRALSFDFFLIWDFKGEPYGKEGQTCQWVDIADLDSFTFAQANVSVLQAVKQKFLPAHQG